MVVNSATNAAQLAAENDTLRALVEQLSKRIDELTAPSKDSTTNVACERPSDEWEQREAALAKARDELHTAFELLDKAADYVDAARRIAQPFSDTTSYLMCVELTHTKLNDLRYNIRSFVNNLLGNSAQTSQCSLTGYTI